MICCGVPRTLPSGPLLSNTRLTTLPKVLLLLLRLRLLLFRERDLEERILSDFQPYFDGLVTGQGRILRQSVRVTLMLA